MSNFNCPECGTTLVDTPGGGYTTECSHYPFSKKAVRKIRVLKDIPGINKGNYILNNFILSDGILRINAHRYELYSLISEGYAKEEYK